jgi:hypothetical protein
MEDGLEQHMSILIQMREQQQENKVEKKPVEKKQAEEQVHPIGLSLVPPSGSQHTLDPKTSSVLITSTNSGS